MNQSDQSDDAAPMDPIAVTLAVWLGLIVSVTGLIRLSEQASARAAMQRTMNTPTEENQPLNPRLVAFGN